MQVAHAQIVKILALSQKMVAIFFKHTKFPVNIQLARLITSCITDSDINRKQNNKLINWMSPYSFLKTVQS